MARRSAWQIADDHGSVKRAEIEAAMAKLFLPAGTSPPARTGKDAVTIAQFRQRFPDDEACCTYLFRLRDGRKRRCSRCGKTGRWYKLASRPAYSCQCGNHFFPMAGTRMHFTRAPLLKWFFGVYLLTRDAALSAKELQQSLDINYHTARRMKREVLSK